MLTVIGLGLVALAPSAAMATGKKSIGSRLLPRSSLSGGSWLESPNGTYNLVMQRDGNLVLYGKSVVVWASDTSSHAGATAVMQPNRAMTLDMNPDWPVFATYDPSTPTGLATPANGQDLVAGTVQGPFTFFEPWWARDFITMSAR